MRTPGFEQYQLQHDGPGEWGVRSVSTGTMAHRLESTLCPSCASAAIGRLPFEQHFFRCDDCGHVWPQNASGGVPTLSPRAQPLRDHASRTDDRADERGD